MNKTKKWNISCLICKEEADVINCGFSLCEEHNKKFKMGFGKTIAIMKEENEQNQPRK
jgi:hypothetical protein